MRGSVRGGGGADQPTPRDVHQAVPGPVRLCDHRGGRGQVLRPVRHRDGALPYPACRRHCHPERVHHRTD